MENQFFVDSEFLSEEALKKKHRLETDPSCRKNHIGTVYILWTDYFQRDNSKNLCEVKGDFNNDRKDNE